MFFEDSREHPAAYRIHSNTAVASISIRKSGRANDDTPTHVLVGGFVAKNSLRALPITSTFCEVWWTK